MPNKILASILIYGLLMPISYLPMAILHCISNGLAFLLHRIIGYRSAIVKENLQRSYPQKSQKEIDQIVSQFYLHLADMVVETIKMFSISKKNLLKRYVFENPAIMQEYIDKKQSVIWVSGHYNNWEFMVLSLALQTPKHGVGVGKRLSNEPIGNILHRLRTRYGTTVVYADNMRSCMEENLKNERPAIYMLLADQSPNDKRRCFWTPFLNQETAMIYGPEYFAQKYNLPILFYRVRKLKRGYYSFSVEKIADMPQQMSYGEITVEYANRLEQLINGNPAYWLWSHRRWKHQRCE